MASSDEITAGLIAVCERYIKVVGLQSDAITSNNYILSTLRAFIQVKARSWQSAQEFINQLHQPSIIFSTAHTSKSIWSFLQDQIKAIEKARKKNKNWEKFKYFLIIIGIFFFGVTAIAARIRTGKGNPLRLLKKPPELFIEDIEKVKQRFNISPLDVSSQQLYPAEIPPQDGSSPFLEIFGQLGSMTNQPKNDDVLAQVINFLPPRAASAFGRTDKRMYSIFKEQRPALQMIKNLLTSVVQGNEDKTKKILDLHPELLLKDSNVVDYSGRNFFCISPFKYALWAGDEDMLKLMQSAIDKLEDKTQIQVQITELATKGVAYEYVAQDGTIIKEMASHGFDHNELQMAYQTYLQKSYRCSEKDLNTCWCQVVGWAQRMLPAWQAQAFCQNYPFYPPPTDEQLLTKLARTFQLGRMCWFPLPGPDAGLGYDFAIFRGKVWGWGGTRWAGGETGGLAPHVRARFEAEVYLRLCTLREEQVQKFKRTLAEIYLPPKPA